MTEEKARKIGQELQSPLDQLKALAKDARARRSPDAEAIEIAMVNLNSAIEILTE